MKKFTDQSTQKALILSEFTRYRSTCEEMVLLLRSLGQNEVADELEKYNTSPGRMQITTEVEIKVTQAKALIKGTLFYEMTKNPRGKCIIINNMPNLFKESQRFEYIFTELCFSVQSNRTENKGLTAEEIRNELKSLAKDRSLAKDEAFLVMIIRYETIYYLSVITIKLFCIVSHGEDEKVLGTNACQELEKGIEYEKRVHNNDVIKISEIVDIFSDKNCTFLRQIPKLFFFNCCRESIFHQIFK